MYIPPAYPAGIEINKETVQFAKKKKKTLWNEAGGLLFISEEKVNQSYPGCKNMIRDQGAFIRCKNHLSPNSLQNFSGYR